MHLGNFFIAGLLLIAAPIRAHNGEFALAYPIDTVAIDGDLSDWPANLPLYTIDAFEVNEPTDAEDFRGSFRIGYNSAQNALYLGIEVIDDAVVSEIADSLVDFRSGAQYARDGSGFFALPAHARDRARPFAVWEDNTQTYRSRSPLVEAQYIAFAKRQTDEGFVYEWRLDAMGLGGAQIEPGTLWSFTVAVCDVDADGPRGFCLVNWGQGSRRGRRFNSLGDVLLVADDRTLGTLASQAVWSNANNQEPPRQVLIESTDDTRFNILVNTDDQGHYAVSGPADAYQITVEDLRLERGLPIHAAIKPGTTTTLSAHSVLRTEPSDYYATLPDLTRVHRGVCWVAANRHLTEYDMLSLAKNGVEWISQTPFGWQSGYNVPEIRLNRQRGFSGERDDGIGEATRLAKKFGIRTMLKPHIWLTDRSDGKWRSDIAMDSEQDWQKWFADYRTFMMHYAQLAEQHDIEALCIGTELYRATIEREADWRALIADIRAVYGGKLIYAANWYEEFEALAFWDALDYIGVQAYFPLVTEQAVPVAQKGWLAHALDFLVEESEGAGRVPSVAALKEGWREHLQAIERVHTKYQKPVIITEIGYHSAIDAAVKPWEWDSDETEATPEERLQTQANCYRAFFEVFWQQDYFAGVYFWKWYPNHRQAGGRDDRDFTPQNKPAAKVMSQWYGKDDS